MHGLGRNGCGVELRWRRAGVAGIRTAAAQEKKASDFSFVQISDSHLGFNKPANTDVAATLQAALDKIDALPHTPDFLIHTGDLTHSSKPAEFDTLSQMLGEQTAGVLCAGGARYLSR